MPQPVESVDSVEVQGQHRAAHDRMGLLQLWRAARAAAARSPAYRTGAWGGVGGQ
jgi:hypothetical protein